MLTRLKVQGFKNLVDVEVRFGPFTCVAGANGVGKSNLLDAITFLSALADQSVVEAALRVRDEDSPRGDVASIFHRYGSEQACEMSFEADMIVPKHGTDDLGQPATATTTFVTYKLSLRYKPSAGDFSGALPIEIVREELTHIRAAHVKKSLGFKAHKHWIESAIDGKRSALFYISTDLSDGTILVHQDGGAGGRTRKLSSTSLPRTVLSSANASENPTATLVRQEMRSWKLLQLEPSALRRPDNFSAPTSLGADGAHLPATLYELSRRHGRAHGTDSRIYTTAANRLAELLSDVRQIRVDRDEKRSLLTLLVAGRDGSFHPARSLSDGTLRFLALAVLELDSKAQGVICMEEPENGIHPARIAAILSLLQDIAVDVTQKVDDDNPLRQVIINTHSPSVVAQVPESSLLVAETTSVRIDSSHAYEKVLFSAIKGTWREKLGVPAVALGKLLTYLSPVGRQEDEKKSVSSAHQEERRVIDNPAIQGFLFGEAS